MGPMKKHLLNMLVVSALLGSTLAACSNNGNTEPEGGANAENNLSETNTNTEPEKTSFTDISTNIRGNTAPTQEQLDEVNNTLNDTYLGDLYEEVIPSDYSAYPYKEKVTLDVWLPADSNIPDYNNQVVQQQVEKLTGIDVNFITPPVGQEADAFTLMISSGELPDIIMEPERYPGGLEAGLNDGAYIDLTDLMEKNAPNYTAWRNSNEMRRKTTVTDSGKLLGFYGIAPYSEWMWFGMLIKKEALEKTGMEVPQTIEEWHAFLLKCKEVGYAEPLNYGSTYGQIFTGIINGAYGVWDWTFMDENGQVQWGPAQPKAKEYLATMQQWNKEGLLNRDWATADFNQRMASAISDKTAVMMDSPDTMWSYWKQQNNIDFVGALNPILNAGDQPATTYKNFMRTGRSAAITTQAENVEAAMAFLDFAYSKKGWEIINYGEYGKIHLIDENGKPYFHEDSYIYKDPDGQPVATTLVKYRMHSWPAIRDEHNANPLIVAKGSYSGEIRKQWTEGMDTSVAMPPITFTQEEASREAELGNQLSTLRGEYFAKIIKGELSVDAYDKFLSEAKKMGLEEFLKLHQAALDRYNQR
ncbi:ABC-type glycerol-3-phosphate transport system substrate-binding protein [Paenibacillus phyllosphaerae]|uniref:ABC-type glycerol-3-phosphate transport system substrate-binding protein n=1 Tax=Paenibacillus phyllosphaerae TaxID=274593 RepID=A0A7W5AUD1_9BACL|nr:extracellular solute-binding protein [Paenibacillus phyllosphaerae]MBB3108833.1 ABC-type glycerol-3-phosphate transport system substrate-binding protein [Paenibacillus phyllosphaerae]